MKKILLALCVLSLCSATPAMSAMDLSQGFLGLEWGTVIADQPGFTLLRSSGGLDYYENKDTAYSVTADDSTQVIFGAVDGKLCAVFINLDTDKGYERSKDYLLNRFGNPKVKKQGQELEYSWLENDVKLRVKLKKNEADGSRKMAFYFMPLMKPGNPAFTKAMDEFPSFHMKSGPFDRREGIPLLNF